MHSRIQSFRHQMHKLVHQSIVTANRFPRLVPALATRGVVYEVSPTGEKTVINKYEGRKSLKEKWQRVRPMGYEPHFRKIKSIEMNERLESDPRVARHTAESKLQSMKDSLLNRGFCRETKPYDPPEDVQTVIEGVCREVIPNEVRSQKWFEVSLKDPNVKFKVLSKCAEVLDYSVPNSLLYLMHTVADAVKFYSTPIRGITSYDQLVQRSDNLPQNLHVIADPIRFNPETDTFFGGISAYPFNDQRVKGLRAKKKYPEMKGHFKWPDV